MNIKIYGTGCPKCKTLAANVVAALAKDGLAAEVEKVTDIDAIVARGILSTPALEINGEIVASGRVLSPTEIRRIVNPEAAQTTVSASKRRTSVLRRIAGVTLVAFALVGLVWPFLRGNTETQSIQETVPQSRTNATVVYYFHGTQRCMTCNKIEELARSAVEEGFAEELNAGRLRVESVNVDDPANEHFIRDFQLTARTIVIAKGKDYQRLDKTWQLVHDEDSFRRYVQENTAAMLAMEISR
jgi:small redox-active disulfide protein 2